ncbi:MAG: thioredoxin-disulfide reductase [Candidatus Omnitrophica bacterium]|nr:thioredoxin-disulfide reductase [Candidatus Omnitrophota bacterium]
MNLHDAIIIGSGSAGLTAGLYAGRFRMDTLVFERMSPGGQILLSPSIDNYPGFPAGLGTEELISRFKKQAEEVGIDIQSKDVLEVKRSSDGFLVRTSEGDFETKTVIVATGAQPKRLDIKGELRLTGKGVSYCGTCDGPLFKEKDIVVIGGGDRAIEEALFLAAYAKKVTIIHRRDEFRASMILVEKAKANPKIDFFLEGVVEEIYGENKVDAVKVRNVKTGAESQVACQGVFVFVGILPNTDFLKNLLDRDEFGFIITDQEMRTSQAGIFACGDCRKKSLYQVVTACGDGAISADSAYKYIINKK